MNNPLYKILLIICLVVIGLVLAFYAFKRVQYSFWKGDGGVPPIPTTRLIEAAAEKPQEQCNCWNDDKSVCLPEVSCL